MFRSNGYPPGAVEAVHRWDDQRRAWGTLEENCAAFGITPQHARNIIENHSRVAPPAVIAALRIRRDVLRSLGLRKEVCAQWGLTDKQVDNIVQKYRASRVGPP